MSRVNDLYYLNGVDMFTGYGFIPAPDCSNDILSSFPIAERTRHKYLDEDGEDVDLDFPATINNKSITLIGYINAISASDFASKWVGLQNAFNVGGTLLLYHTESNLTHNVFLKNQIKVLERYTRLRYTDNIWLKIEIQLEAVPNAQASYEVIGGADGGTIYIITA